VISCKLESTESRNRFRTPRDDSGMPFHSPATHARRGGLRELMEGFPQTMRRFWGTDTLSGKLRYNIILYTRFYCASPAADFLETCGGAF
jgi:hypothetical protein